MTEKQIQMNNTKNRYFPNNIEEYNKSISFFMTGCDSVKHYPNKRLLATTSIVLNTTNVTSEEQCVMSCYYEKTGCLAANVITTSNVIMCQMTTGLSKESDMMDDSTSVLYVTSKQFEKCPSETMKLSNSNFFISPLRK